MGMGSSHTLHLPAEGVGQGIVPVGVIMGKGVVNNSTLAHIHGCIPAVGVEEIMPHCQPNSTNL